MTGADPFQKAAYTLLWYLSGQGGLDYSGTTRRDMIECVLCDLQNAGLLEDSKHQRGLEAVTEAYAGHPLESLIVETMNNMPRVVDADIGGVNAVGWVRYDNNNDT